MANATSEEQAPGIAAVFNRVAMGYDRQALRFFPYSADKMVARLKPKPGEKVLDVATGTGAVALAAAQAVGAGGRVVGIDIAEAMLAEAEKKIRKFGINNIDLHTMDASALDFRSGYFDSVTCAYALFFLPDMQAGLNEWKRVLKPGGSIIFTSFGPAAFRPMLDLFMARLALHDVVTDPAAGARLNDPAQCRQLLAAAGLTDVEVVTEQLGYHLKDATEWWEIVYNAGLRGMLDKLAPHSRDVFQREHLQEVGELVTESGLWLNVETLFSVGRKPSV